MDATIAGHRLTGLPADDDHPYRTGPWQPQTREWDATGLDVLTGEIPPDLEGVYLRNTENPVRLPIKRYHPFDGDGMLHAVTFRGGQASYRNRFVPTDGLRAEDAAGEALWAGIAENPRNAKRPDGWGARGRMKDASSTDVVVHHGQALTSFWQCGDLYAFDPLTMEAKGKAPWVPAGLGVSAHSRVDEQTGDLMWFNYGTAAPYLHYGVVDRSGQMVHHTPVELPGARLPHDLAFTENYTVLNDLPLFWDRDLIDQGLYASRFHPDVPSRFGIIPRFGTEVRWFEAEPTYVLHWANAYEEGDEVVLDGFFQSCPEPADYAAGGPPDRMFRFLAADALGTRLHRWRFNLRTGLTKEEDLSDRTSEFGMIDGRVRGRPHRYVFAATNPAGWFLMDGILRHDTWTGAVDEYRFPEGAFCSETAVGSGGKYLVTLAIDMISDSSYAAVFAAADVAAGPIATVALPERVSSGTHSFWAHGPDIAGWNRPW